jgi:large subunit ribosomal protein L21
MYVIFENGGKQYKAVEGGFIEIDLLPEEIGQKKSFENVLLLSTDEKVEVGTPYLKGVSVDTTIVDHFKGQKITVFKYRPKQRYRVKTGHRQRYSRVLVDSIAFPGKSETATKTTEVNEPELKPTAKKPAAKKPASEKSTKTKPASTKKSTAEKSTTAKKKPAADKK